MSSSDGIQGAPSGDGKAGKLTIGKLVRQAASQLVAQDDVWGAYNIPRLPAERVVRHLYEPTTQSWHTDETIVKMQTEPFAHGAMRHCFRLKKMATPPQSASNHRFHAHGWSRASNYVAKAYMTADGQAMDCSEAAKEAVQNDIVLQYEAMHWAQKFNDLHPPRTIVFLRAYAIELVNRPGQPWLAVERFIAGKDDYGAGFVKHNTNSGFVDEREHRRTPQVFSAYSFYASHGTRLVADIQGVSDLYTDPQVLSADYRFGEGDLGPRGMALFFHSFRHSSYSDLLGIPTFPLSRHELKRQAKYHEDDLTVSEEGSLEEEEARLDKERRHLVRLDLNRLKRNSLLKSNGTPADLTITVSGTADSGDASGDGSSEPAAVATTETMATAKRSNMTHAELQSSVQKSMAVAARSKKPHLARSQSDVDELQASLRLATQDATFDFHRTATGALRHRTSEVHTDDFRHDVVPAPPLVPNDACRANLGRVHYHLACLHGLGRFVVVEDNHTAKTNADADDSSSAATTPDGNSIVFHLAHACSLKNLAACLALGRLRAGLPSHVAPPGLLESVVPVDFEAAKDLLQRALESSEADENNNARGKAAAACLLWQIWSHEDGTTAVTLAHLLEETLQWMQQADAQAAELQKHSERLQRGGAFHVGDRVEGNYFMEGTYYPGTLTAVNETDNTFTVQYDDDGSSETLPADAVRPLVPPMATARRAEVGLDEAAALGLEQNPDENCLVERYTVQLELAKLKVQLGAPPAEAAALYEQAAEGAMEAGQMKLASECSLKAAELVEEEG